MPHGGGLGKGKLRKQTVGIRPEAGDAVSCQFLVGGSQGRNGGFSAETAIIRKSRALVSQLSIHRFASLLF